MSHVGKLTRGCKWWANRNIEGNLPIDIEADPEKMVDVNYYKKFIEGVNFRRIEHVLKELIFLGRNAAAKKKQRIYILTNLLKDKENFKTREEKVKSKGKK